jgi:hypothetical protein
MYLREKLSWCLAGLLALAAVYGWNASRQPGRRGGDMLDAVAAVQRRSPRFLVSEPVPRANWARGGALYLCRTPRTAAEVDDLGKQPSRPDPSWAGVVCFKGTGDPHELDFPWVSEGGDRCLLYPEFAVFGDPEMLNEVRAILSAEGFQPVCDP